MAPNFVSAKKVKAKLAGRTIAKRKKKDPPTETPTTKLETFKEGESAVASNPEGGESVRKRKGRKMGEETTKSDGLKNDDGTPRTSIHSTEFFDVVQLKEKGEEYVNDEDFFAGLE